MNRAVEFIGTCFGVVFIITFVLWLFGLEVNITNGY